MNPSLIFLALERKNLTSLLIRSVNDRVVDVKMKMAVLVDVMRFPRRSGGRSVTAAANRTRVIFRRRRRGRLTVSLWSSWW